MANTYTKAAFTLTMSHADAALLTIAEQAVDILDTNGDDDLDEEYAVLIDQYMDSRTFTEWEAYPIVYATTGPNFRSISAEASYEIDTYFLSLIGIRTLPVLARAQAQHARNDVAARLSHARAARDTAATRMGDRGPPGP